ncbi:MAG: hypothetical protein HY275_00935, partial [Gemmatimonadetes bacterium]|nr:hypothetical protein [Gemmatimonadota bacterium]
LVEEQHAFAPTDSWLLVHAVTHALADADERAGAGFRLRYWLDGAVLVLGGEIRWELVRDRIESGEVGDPRLARGWLWAASRLAGQPIGMDELGTGDLTALQLERLLAWRLTVLSRYAGTDRWGRKLLEEGARAEVGLLPERPWKPLGPIAELRRRAATRAARLAWGWWRFRL